MTYSAPLKTALLALLLVLPTIGSAQSFKRVETESEFAAHVVGKTLRWDTGETVIFADGTTRGQMQAVGSYHGTWYWQDGLYCRALIVNDVAGDPKCLLVEIADTRLRMSYDKGAGRSLELDISDN